MGLLALSVVAAQAPSLSGPEEVEVAEDAAVGTKIAEYASDGVLALSGTGNTDFFLSPTTGALTVAQALNFEATPSYALTVTATEGGETTTLSITVTVLDVGPAISGLEQVEVAEDAAVDTEIAKYTSDGELALSGTGNTDFALDSTTGALTVAQALNFEATDSYALTVTATEGSETTTLSITVTVLDVSPAISGLEQVEVAEDAAVGTKIAEYASDGVLALSGTGNTDFFLSPTTGALTVAQALNFEATPSYALTVTATEGGETTTLSITVTVLDVGPAISGLEQVEVAEDAAVDTEIAKYTSDGELALSGTGNTDFALDSTTGALTVAQALNFEATDSYALTVTATEGSETTALSITVTVLDVGPAISGLEQVEVAEDAAVDTEIAKYTSDGELALSGTGNTDFALDPTTGALTVAQALNFEATDSYALTVTATEGSETTTLSITVTVLDVGPAISGLEQVEVAEDAAVDTEIAKYTSDGELALSGTGNADFALDPTTGALTVAQALDFETPPSSYALTVTATEGSETTALSVTVTVLDVGPAISGPEQVEVAEDAAVDTEIAKYTSDGVLSGPGNANFALDPTTGALTVARALDFETTDSYELTVTATVGGVGGETTALSVTVTVLDVGPAISGPEQVEVAEDAAVDTEIAKYASDGVLSGPGNANFALDPTTGALTVAQALDFEANDSYELTVTAMDGSGEPGTLKVTVVEQGSLNGDGTTTMPLPPTTSTPSSTPSTSSSTSKKSAPAPAPAPTPELLFASSNSVVTVSEREDAPGQSSLVFQRHDQPAASFAVSIGWISRDGASVIATGFVRDEAPGADVCHCPAGVRRADRAPVDRAQQPVGLRGPLGGREQPVHRADGQSSRLVSLDGQYPAAEPADAALRRRR